MKSSYNFAALFLGGRWTMMAWRRLLATTLGMGLLAMPAAISAQQSSVPQGTPTRNLEPLEAAARTARWQLAHLPPVPSATRPASASAPTVDDTLMKFAMAESPANLRSWHQATFWLGMTGLAEQPSSAWAKGAVLAHGRATQWQLGDRLYNADDHLIGKVWLWSARHGTGTAAIKPLQAAFDKILADPPRVHLALYLGSEGMRAYPKADCLKRWCWADALFMAPATWIGLSNATGDRRYRDFAVSEFWAASNFLYDPAERLYLRDSRFFDLRDSEGRKIYWSRGNGWVLAGLAQMLDTLPARDPEHRRIEAHFREFATRVATLQKADGFWPSSLLDQSDMTPESSGTALFTYALAWGVKHRVLPRAQFEPAARKGWGALQTAVRPDGALGWVQPAGDRPGKATAEGIQLYATGAYLLAAKAIADLDGAKTKGAQVDGKD